MASKVVIPQDGKVYNTTSLFSTAFDVWNDQQRNMLYIIDPDFYLTGKIGCRGKTKAE